MYIGSQYENINIGDEFVVWEPRYRGGEYTRVRKVVKVTATQFTLEPEIAKEDQTEETPAGMTKNERFLRSTGVKIGSGDRWRARRAVPATEKMMKEVAEYQANAQKAENDAAAKARAEETALREKYGATDISDEAVQKKYLRPLRTIAEQSEKTIAYYMKEFEDAELKPENLRHYARRMERAVKGREIFVAMDLKEMILEDNERLIKMLLEFYTGTRFEVDGEEIASGEELAKAFLTYQLQREESRFFNYGIDGVDSRTIAQHKYISELRTIVGTQYNYSAVKEIKENDDA